MAEVKQDEGAKKHKLLKPLHYKGRLIDPKVEKGVEVELYLDQAASLKKQGVIG